MRLSRSLLILAIFPGTGVAQEATSDTALVAAAIAEDLAERRDTLYVSDEWIGKQVAEALGTEALPHRPQPVCPWGPHPAEDSGFGIVARLDRLGDRDARVEIWIGCRFDGPHGGYGAVYQYHLEKVTGEWRIVSKDLIMES